MLLQGTGTVTDSPCDGFGWERFSGVGQLSMGYETVEARLWLGEDSIAERGEINGHTARTAKSTSEAAVRSK